jgi:hypothetical protein
MNGHFFVWRAFQLGVYNFYTTVLGRTNYCCDGFAECGCIVFFLLDYLCLTYKR